MKVQTVPKLTCKRCKYSWRPRNDIVKICPKCKSTKWNERKHGKA